MRADEQPVLSVLMPVFNEAATVGAAIDRLEKNGPRVPVELVVVDDGSTDGSAEIVEARASGSHWIRFVRHGTNRGKGHAIRSALDAATGQYSCIYDADLEYDPADMAHLLEPLVDGRAEAVYGIRAFGGHAAHSFWYVVGNRAINMITNVLFNCWLRDVMTCFKMMPTDVFRSLDLRSNGFDLEPEITAKLLRGGRRIYEVPISYRARSRAEGKKLVSFDGLRVVGRLARVRFSSR